MILPKTSDGLNCGSKCNKMPITRYNKSKSDTSKIQLSKAAPSAPGLRRCATSGHEELQVHHFQQLHLTGPVCYLCHVSRHRACGRGAKAMGGPSTMACDSALEQGEANHRIQYPVMSKNTTVIFCCMMLHESL